MYVQRIRSEGLDYLYLRKVSVPSIRLLSPYGSRELQIEVERLLAEFDPLASRPRTIAAAARDYEARIPELGPSPEPAKRERRLKTLLEEIGRGKPDQHVLLNSRKNPWTGNGLTHLVVDATTAAGVEKTLHDARGTFATRLRLAGLDRDQIAHIMGWKKDLVDRILTRCVDQATIITAMVEKLRANERRTKTPKRRPNTSVSGRNLGPK